MPSDTTIGVDFGTTNSGAALVTDGRLRALTIDPTNEAPTVMRSLLYITREHEVSVGRAALDAYYAQNIGRPSRMVRQRVGEIEVTAADMAYIRDVYVLVDELSPGRLLRSLKSSLATSYKGTTIFDRYYTLEELIALFLGALREQAEQQLGQPVKSVVLGRPVHFVGSNSTETDREQDVRAQERLRQAAHMAGFCQVEFELEPVAAAAHYGRITPRPQTIAVFDFGGGTLDITVMRIGEGERQHVFAAGGVGIAGDVFDRRIIEGTLLEHFGRGSTWGPNHDRFPDAYTDALSNWQTVLELNTPDTLSFLRWVQTTSSHRTRVHALESLLVNNYIALLFDQAERAKTVLSERHFSPIRLKGEGLQIWQGLSRTQFEALISENASQIEACLLDTLARSGKDVSEIDAVVRTGGSAQIPLFVRLLERIFGSEKVVLTDVFGSVTAGLAIRAAQGV
jgi:hypothetical chaperone protein